MKKYISKYVKYILPILFIIISIVTYNIGSKKHEVIFLNKNTKYISVYVKGAIKNEKKLKVKKNATLEQIINLCGGINEEADISNLNMKQKVKDGDIIEITDLTGRTLQYAVYDKFVVEPDDLDCTSQRTNGMKEVTLITCTNDSSQRVIVKAREV